MIVGNKTDQDFSDLGNGYGISVILVGIYTTRTIHHAEMLTKSGLRLRFWHCR